MSNQPFDNRYISSSEGTNPIILEMPHSGLAGFHSIHEAPEVMARKIRFKSEAVRNTIGGGCDSAVPTMSGFLNLKNHHNVSTVHNTLARTYCDTNRSANEVSGWALTETNPNEHHHGVIWARTLVTNLTKTEMSLQQELLEALVRQKCERMLSEPLTMTEFDSLMTEVYDLHHAKIRYLQQSAIKRHGFCVHLALHSLPPLAVTKVNGGYVMGQRATRGPFDMAKNTLPDIILIHNNFKAAHKDLVDSVREAFEQAGLIVEDGKGPFLGDIGVTKIYGNPPKGVNIIGIEHVSHDTEPERHLGSPVINYRKSLEYQKAYRQAVLNLLAQ